MIKLDLNHKNLKNHYSTIFYLLILTLIVSFISYNCFLIQVNIGPVWDTYDLLANAALMSGKGVHYFDLLRPPFSPLFNFNIF